MPLLILCAAKPGIHNCTKGLIVVMTAKKATELREDGHSR
jgi:hypothetical protein